MAYETSKVKTKYYKKMCFPCLQHLFHGEVVISKTKVTKCETANTLPNRLYRECLAIYIIQTEYLPTHKLTETFNQKIIKSDKKWIFEFTYHSTLDISKLKGDRQNFFKYRTRGNRSLIKLTKICSESGHKTTNQGAFLFKKFYIYRLNSTSHID